jgi:hypothetical protein
VGAPAGGIPERVGGEAGGIPESVGGATGGIPERVAGAMPESVGGAKGCIPERVGCMTGGIPDRVCGATGGIAVSVGAVLEAGTPGGSKPPPWGEGACAAGGNAVVCRPWGIAWRGAGCPACCAPGG